MNLWMDFLCVLCVVFVVWLVFECFVGGCFGLGGDEECGGV